ncbi:MAG: methylated-DNA--[protein]-cysteine S-methyltransferase, partial [candidate division Zixibacteria bacterium]|nr:methylated-DNA--[protein]-cysteine S-methyltransferase [candidate division Zixibacteria bacterium]
MDCREIVPHLDGYRTGEMLPTIRRSIADHLKECPACRKELEMLERLTKTAKHLSVPAPSRIAEQVRVATADRYSVTETDFGRVWIGFTPKGITLLRLSSEDADAFETHYQHRLGRRPVPGTAPDRYVEAVRMALEGRKPHSVPIVLDGLADFERIVLDHLARIPVGEVRPYAWLAREAGRPSAVRAVGTVMARNPVPFLLPCHRVVPSTGGVGNYGYGSQMKRELLEREGVAVKTLEAMAHSHIRFTGSRTTGIFCYPT